MGDTPTTLRLARAGDARAAWPREAEARAQIAASNADAAGQSARSLLLDQTDPRWVLAASARAQLQGAVLTPQRRARLERMGRRLGLRPFDTSVVLAVVQDAARCGAPNVDVARSIALLPHPGERRASEQRQSARVRWGAAILCASVGAAFAIWWILGAS